MLNKINTYDPLSNFNKAINTLKEHNIRPTKQRMVLAKLLFEKGRRHISAEDLHDEVKDSDRKISLATVYNTIHAFNKKGYVKEVTISNDKTYFDTNTKSHHHFYDLRTNELIDIDSEKIQLKHVPQPPKGKKINGIEVVINVKEEI